MTAAETPEAHGAAARAGVLLINLGTPDAPTAPAIRRYLREFLSDQRVVEAPRWLWLPFLHLILLNTRPKKLVPRYASIWTPEGSPLLAIGRAQAAGLRHRLAGQLGTEVPVALAMRYGSPDIAQGLAELRAQGVRRIVLLPLFPQYSATTTAAALDAVFAALKPLRWLPELHSINSYHDDPGYITALAHSVEAHWAVQGRGEHLLMSFHGIPQRYFALGDPYFCHCQKTARLLAEKLRLPADAWSVAFQSRLGREPWLKPYTDEHLPRLAARGVKTLDVIAPGFSADCLETLEEVCVEYRALFARNGGELRYVPALNASAAHLDALSGIAAPALQGWLLPALTAAEQEQQSARIASAKTAAI